MSAPPDRIVSASILSSDFGRFFEETAAVAAAGADWIHIDVMDGRFVPNITFGPGVVKAIRAATTLPFDVHLMIAPADPFLEAFREAGADHINVHPEAGPHIDRTCRRIRELGAKAGVALNPSTPVGAVEFMLDDVDILLVMTVNPGFGGQSFLTSQLKKIERLAEMVERAGLDIVIEVDGGVAADNVRACLDAGARALVSGTSTFKGGPGAYADNIAALRRA